MNELLDPAVSKPEIITGANWIASLAPNRLKKLLRQNIALRDRLQDKIC